MLCAMHQGPAAYRDLTCVEPEPGYVQRLFHYFTISCIEKVCPTPADLTRRIGNQVSETASEKNCQPWCQCSKNGERARPSLCRHCGTVPCQVKRRCLWMPPGPRRRDKANFAGRSKAMTLFSYGLELSVQLTKELPRNELYWERRFCDRFEEKHMVLFPLCIQRQINFWYPVLPYRCFAPVSEKIADDDGGLWN